MLSTQRPGGAPTERRIVGREDWLRVATLVVLALAVQGLWTATSAAADSPDFTVEAGPVDGDRAEDGASELTIVATNLSSNELRLSLSIADGSCDSVVGQPSLAPYTAGEVTFKMNCDGGSAPRAATLTGKTTQVPEVPLTPASVPLQVTLKPEDPLLDLTVAVPLADTPDRTGRRHPALPLLATPTSR